MFKYLDKEYVKYLIYRSLALGLSAVGISYFIVNFLNIEWYTAIGLLLISLFLTSKSIEKPKLARCLDQTSYGYSFFINFGISISFISLVLLILHTLNKEAVSFYAYLSIAAIGVICIYLYFRECKK